MRTLLAIAGLMAVVPTVALAQAIGIGTLGQYLTSFESVTTTKCLSRGELEKQFIEAGKPAEARYSRLAEEMVCECMPRQVRQLRLSLSSEALDEVMTGEAFQDRYGATIVNPCAAAQLRATYGAGCADAGPPLYASTEVSPAKYCACMDSSISKLSDGTMAAIAGETSAYIPKAAEAKRLGEPLPEHPENLRRFTEIDRACKVPR